MAIATLQELRIDDPARFRACTPLPAIMTAATTLLQAAGKFIT